jgi:hypothetical protein
MHNTLETLTQGQRGTQTLFLSLIYIGNLSEEEEEKEEKRGQTKFTDSA